MGEVDHAQHREHQGVAQGKQGIDRPNRETVKQQLQQGFHALWV